MKVRLQITALGGILETVVIDAEGETGPEISQAVADLAISETWATGDTLTITEVQP